MMLVNAVLVALWSSGLASNLAVENGVMETLQLLLAAGAFAVFLFAALEDDGAVGSAGTALAGIAAIAVVREIDVRTIVVPDWMMVWANGPFRDISVSMMLLVVLAYLWWRREHGRDWLTMLLRQPAWPLWVGGGLLTLSLAFDGGRIIAGEAGVMIEELVELNGFMLLLAAGFRHCQLLRGKQAPAEALSRR